MCIRDRIKVGFETSGVPEDLTFEEFKERQYYAFPTREDWKDIPAGIRQFHDDPEGHPLRTPSGKLEYLSLIHISPCAPSAWPSWTSSCPS